MTSLTSSKIVIGASLIALALGGPCHAAPPATVRRSCGLKSPLAVVLAARSTPVVGQELILSIDVNNGLRDGAVRTTIDLPPGCAEVTGDLASEVTLALGASRHQELRIKVLTAEPFDVAARVRSLDFRDARLPPGESILAIRPVNLGPAGPSLAWNPQTLRSKSKPTPPELRLSDGRSVIRIRIPGRPRRTP